MEESLSTFEHNGKRVSIYFDPEPEHANPREYDGNLGIMLANGHRNYTLGDEDQLRGKKAEDYDTAANALSEFADRGKVRLFPRWAEIYLGSTVVLPLGLIDHSGISMYVGGGAHPADPGGWDSGLVGFIFDTPATHEENGSEWTPEELTEALRAEVHVYNEVLTGQVFGYVVEDDEGEVDSCWGFVGDDYCEQEARDAAGYTCKHCGRAIFRWVGTVLDGEPDRTNRLRFAHKACGTCHGDITYEDKSWWHLSDDGILSLPHEVVHAERLACHDGEHHAETDQTVNTKAL